MPLTEIYFSRFIVLNLFPRSEQFIVPTSRQLLRHSLYGSCSILSYLSAFILLDLCISFVPPDSQTLLERSDISIKFIWVPIMYVVIMSYIWIGL